MATEIERKFLVTGNGWKNAKKTYYCQGYLNRDPHRTVRVRIAGDNALLTVKGVTIGARRNEYEYPIPLEDAKEILAICEGPSVEKHRRVIMSGGLNWEIDEFLGNNQGLVIAEVELDSEDQEFELPKWIGNEVTDDVRYTTTQISLATIQHLGRRSYIVWDRPNRLLTVLVEPSGLNGHWCFSVSWKFRMVSRFPRAKISDEVNICMAAVNAVSIWH